MSAQIITALRRRADALSAEAEEIDVPDGSTRAAVEVLRFLAEQFRALADEAESR